LLAVEGLIGNHNATVNIPREKLKQKPPCLPHQPKRNNGAKAWQIYNTAFKIRNGKRSWVSKDMISCNHMEQMTFI